MAEREKEKEKEKESIEFSGDEGTRQDNTLSGNTRTTRTPCASSSESVIFDSHLTFLTPT
jgi:hypothetical protein